MPPYAAVLLRSALASAATAFAVSTECAATAEEAIVGRRGVDIHASGSDLPSWPEIRRSGARMLAHGPVEFRDLTLTPAR